METRRGQRDNALQEILRLTKKFEEEMCEEGSGKRLVLSMSPDGGGALVLNTGCIRVPLFQFQQPGELKKFLLMTAVEKIVSLASVAWHFDYSMIDDE
jgi:hypothetical protein